MYTSLDIANVFDHEAICVKEKSTHFNLPKLLLEASFSTIEPIEPVGGDQLYPQIFGKSK